MVVVVADLGKPFNVSDLRAEVILDEAYGLCPQIKPPHTGKRYPSLPYWLARRRQRREMLGEELRLLYVAMTRARDTLILSGSISETKSNQLWQPDARSAGQAFLGPLLWRLAWLVVCPEPRAGRPGVRPGENALVRWQIHDEPSLFEPVASGRTLPRGIGRRQPQAWEKLQRRLLDLSLPGRHSPAGRPRSPCCAGPPNNRMKRTMPIESPAPGSGSRVPRRAPPPPRWAMLITPSWRRFRWNKPAACRN